MIRSRRLAGAVLLVYASVVLLIVWYPTADVPISSVHRIWLLLQDGGAPDWVSPRGVEFAANMLLFVPLSLVGSTFRPLWRWWAWLIVGALISSLIELGQMIFLDGRSQSLEDVAANSLGALLGYLLLVAWRSGRDYLRQGGK